MAKRTKNDPIAQAFLATSRAVMITDSRGQIVAVNKAFSDLTDWSAVEAKGRTPSILSSGRQDADFFKVMWMALEGEGHWQGDLWNRRKGGEVYPEHLTIDAIRGEEGEITHYVGIFANIEEQWRRETYLAGLAFRDLVTGLPSRSLCEDRLERAIALARRRAGHMAVHMIDLDGFKKINGAFGHECGDLVLKATSERLRACLRESDTLARWDGDKFMLVQPLVDGANGVREVGLRLLAALRRPFVIAGDEISLSGSIGAAIFPGDGDTVEEIVSCTDRTMVRVKQGGKGGFALHSDGEAHNPARRRAV